MNAVALESATTSDVSRSLSQRLSVIQESRQVGWQAVAKRLLDVIVSLTVLIIMLPLGVVIAILIYLESGRPIFFRQRRLGLKGSSFNVIKLRSMHKDAELRLSEVMSSNEIKDGPIFKWRKDPRITKTGAFLRRTSLDELPQLFNVLKGEMSLVGPRPPLESEVLRYEPWQMQRLSVKPGMTGLWQVSGRSNLTFNQMVRLDIAYAEHWSIWEDVILLLRTPLTVLSGRGAY